MKVVQWAKSGLWHAVQNEAMRSTHCGRYWPNDDGVNFQDVKLRASLPHRCEKCFD